MTLKDIAKYPLILPPKEQSTYRVVEMVFAEHSLEYDIKLEVGGYDVIKKYVELGLGISIVMSHCLSGADHLHAVPLGRWFPKRTYGVVLRKGRTLSPAAERFVEMIRADVDKSRRRGRREAWGWGLGTGGWGLGTGLGTFSPGTGISLGCKATATSIQLTPCAMDCQSCCR